MSSATQTGGDPVARFGELGFRTLEASAFGGALSMFEVELAPGCLAGPLHVHEREDAVSYVLAGQLTFQVGAAVIPVTSGGSVLLPRHVPHTFWNAGPEPARAVDVVTPGGLERYYEALAQVATAPDAMDRVVQLEQRYGVIMDWASFPDLLARHGLRTATG